MKKIFLLLYFILFFVPILLRAQQNPVVIQTDSVKTRIDSVANTERDKQLNAVTQLSLQRLSDSLKRTELKNKFANLKPEDTDQKAVLLKALTDLKKQDSLHSVKQKGKIDSLRKFVKAFPVKFDRDTIFYLYAKLGSFTALDRADALALRMEQVSENLDFKKDSIAIVPAEQTLDLVYKNKLLTSVSDQDALWANQPRAKLADSLKIIIGNAIIKHQKDNSWQTLLKEILLTLLVIAVVVALIYGVNRFLKRLNEKIKLHTELFKDGFKIKNFEVLTAERKVNLFDLIIKIIRWGAIILLVYLALPVLFSIFPFTRNLSDNLINYFLSPVKKIGKSILDYIPNLITILVIVVVFRYALRFLKFLKTEIEHGNLRINGFYADWASPTYQIMRVLILAFMLIVIFPYLPGSDSNIFKGVSVFIGVLFTFGSAGALGNVVAGLVLTYMRAFNIGDRVQIGEVVGDILEKTILVTRIRTIQNEVVSIPNSTVMTNHTINFSAEATGNGLIVHTTVTIGYDVPWKQVHQLLIDAALGTEMIEKEPKPYVLQTSLDDYYVSYKINAFTKQPNRQSVIYSYLHANIQDKFNEAGVEIMSPHYRAMRDGNTTTVPTDYLPKDYVAPAFKTEQQQPK
ncbi:mechanosensitive ion channel family protein [Pedobacter sp. UYP30]|uniref:mechanosensitive ion channel family protein n=1 Tax=Pedobacter sp. UYP30 TaxID=1756400 RepID=UPI00339B2471